MTFPPCDATGCPYEGRFKVMVDRKHDMNHCATHAGNLASTLQLPGKNLVREYRTSIEV